MRDQQEATGIGGATDDAKGITADLTRHLIDRQDCIGPHITHAFRHGNMIDARGENGRRFIIIVEELP